MRMWSLAVPLLGRGLVPLGDGRLRGVFVFLGGNDFRRRDGCWILA